MGKTKLEKVVDIISGFAFDSRMFNDYGGTPLIRIRDVKRGYTETYTTQDYDKKYIIKNGDILIGMDGEFNIGKWKSKEALLNQRVCKIIPKKINADYLFYLLPKKLKSIESRTAFVTVKHLSVKQIENIEIDLIEMEQQKKVAKKLEIISEIIETKQVQIEQLDELIKSQFVEMFGDPFLNEKSWKTNTIGECCTLKSGTSLPAEVENEGGDVLYIKVGDMNLIGNEKNITTSNHRVTEKTAGKGIFELGTILFPKRGGAIGTNKKRLTVSKVCADLNVMGVTPTSKLLSEYLYTYFLFIDLGSLNNGSSVPQINNKDIEPLIIPLPPIECQNQFADFVKVIDKQKFEIQKSLEEMQLLQESLMNKYFGEM